MGIMSWRYYDGEDGETEDDDKAFEFATKAAKEGDKLGKIVLGGCYYYERGVAEDQVAALNWYEESSAKKSRNGMSFSGQMYSAGKGA